MAHILRDLHCENLAVSVGSYISVAPLEVTRGARLQATRDPGRHHLTVSCLGIDGRCWHRRKAVIVAAASAHRSPVYSREGVKLVSCIPMPHTRARADEAGAHCNRPLASVPAPRRAVGALGQVAPGPGNTGRLSRQNCPVSLLCVEMSRRSSNRYVTRQHLPVSVRRRHRLSTKY